MFCELKPGVDLVVEDDEDNEGPDDVEEEVHPQDIDLQSFLWVK